MLYYSIQSYLSILVFNCILQKRYPCDEGNSYALEFGEKFCSLYKHRYSKFNDIGQKWVDGVRKCLQVQLVPILGPSVRYTCQQIKTNAFDTHSGCYIYPGEGKPSVCDIGLINWWRVFLTIKGAVIMDAKATFKQTVDVIQSCGVDLLSDWIEIGNNVF